MAPGKTRRTFMRLLVLATLVGVAFVAVAAFRAGPPPQVTVEPQMPGIGRSTPVDIVVEEPVRGVSRFRVELVQGDLVRTVEERSHDPLPPWKFWGPRVPREDLTVNVGNEVVPDLREGKAQIRVVAERASSWLRYPGPVTRSVELPVLLRPPSLQVMSTHTYVTQGGCEAVVYRVGETSVRDGVQAGDWWFPGHPLPGGGERDRFALFGAPYDLDEVNRISLIAEDSVGNRAEAGFVDRFFPKPFRTDTIRLDQSFMQRVVPAIMSQTPELRDQGGLLENYLLINGDLRRRNTEALIEMSSRSAPEFLWAEAFLPMRNAQVMSSFADRRTYTFEGQAVDQQDHLGFDLASTSMAEIQAANRGKVVLARYFGIYGNAVVLDHGYGLMSLYGHLSSLSVEEGQTVERGDLLGRSGVTGLAGGDHLHFTMLLNGLPVNPREWWDDHWIHDRIKLKLGAAMPFEG